MKEKPVKTDTPVTPPVNPPVDPPVNPPVNPPVTPPTNSGDQPPYGINKLNYKFLNFEGRKNDAGFKAVDALSVSVNTDTLGKSPVVIGAYYQAKGMNAEYIIYY